MATAAAAQGGPKEFTFVYEGKDKGGKSVRGEIRSAGENMAQAALRRQGIIVSSFKKQKRGSGGSVSEKDVALFTRQMATMMKAGVPLLQAFDIVSKGAANPAVGRLLIDIKTEVETGSSLAQAFRKYPLYFDALYCNLVAAGRAKPPEYRPPRRPPPGCSTARRNTAGTCGRPVRGRRRFRPRS